MVSECNFQGKRFFFHATYNFIFYFFVALFELLNQDDKLQLVALVFPQCRYFRNQYNELS
jgi:hypothetical protein